MKKMITVLCSLLLCFGIAFAFAGCDFGSNSSNKLSVSNENIKIEYTEYLGYQVKVTGTITNTTKSNLSYISVEYKIYDASGAVVGTALDNANNISAGETWRFEANSFTWFDARPSKVTFSKIQTIKDF